MKKWIAVMIAAVLMIGVLAGCGGTSNTPAATKTPLTGGTVYTYEQDMGTYTVTWTLTLLDDGSYTLDELNGRLNYTTNHAGKSYSNDSEGRLVTGPWNEANTVPEFASADGTITWIVDGSKISPYIDESAFSKLAGTYTYEEDKGDFKVTWTLTLNKDYTYGLSEVHGLSGNETNHTGSSYTDDGESLVQCGPWDASDNVSDFMAPNGACDWIVNTADGTMVPANEGEGGDEASVNPGKYVFEDGDKVWEVLLMGNGGNTINLYDSSYNGDGSTGLVAEITTEGWTDLGNGYFQTGAWQTEGVDAHIRLSAPNGICTWKVTGPDGDKCEPCDQDEATGKKSTAVNPGKYLYVDEANGYTWEVLIMGNGKATVAQFDTAAYNGDSETGLLYKHECRTYNNEEYCWVDNEDGSFETGEWVPEERDDPHPHEKFTSPNGVTNWKVTGDGIVEPTEKVEAFAYYGALDFASYSKETGENWKIMLMGNGDCTVQTWDADGKRIDEWVPKGFRVDDATHFILFPFEDDTGAPPFLEANGMTQWEITDGENRIVEFVGMFNPG